MKKPIKKIKKHKFKKIIKAKSPWNDANFLLVSIIFVIVIILFIIAFKPIGNFLTNQLNQAVCSSNDDCNSGEKCINGFCSNGPVCAGTARQCGDIKVKGACYGCYNSLDYEWQQGCRVNPNCDAYTGYELMCLGTATPCEKLSPTECESQEGCNIINPFCTGTPALVTPCENYGNYDDCIQNSGCIWNDGDACEGSPSPLCSDYIDRLSCEARGCLWNVVDYFNLSIKRIGTGSGQITINSSGGNCGSDCYNYTSGTLIGLSVKSNSGSYFSGWFGDCTGIGNCSLTMNQNYFVTANFTKLCGNGVIDSGEQCDGTNLNEKTCITQGYRGGGTLSCNSNCNSFNTSLCVYGLTTKDETDLRNALEVMSAGWVQSSADVATRILGNSTYNSNDWNTFFEKYFNQQQHNFTDSLRNYIGYPVFYWSSDSAKTNLQTGFVEPLWNKTNRIFSSNPNLEQAMNNDVNIRQTLFNSHRIFVYISQFNAVSDSTKTIIFDKYKTFINSYPNYMKAYITFDKNSNHYVPSLRAQMWMAFSEIKNLTPEIKTDIANTIGLSGWYNQIWNNFSILIHDNNQFSQMQKDAVYNLLISVPKEMHNLRHITVADMLGNQNWNYYSGYVTKSGVNIFSDEVGTVPENQFPNDVSPRNNDIFKSALAHEVNHIVDAYSVNTNSTRKARKDVLISQAGSTGSQYLRCNINDNSCASFFQNNPQEFFASISNQWFSDSKYILDLGIARFDNGYKEPLNQFLFFAEVYSRGGNSTITYTSSDTTADIIAEDIPVIRDSKGWITALIYDGKNYSFIFDNNGSVLSYSRVCNQQNCNYSLISGIYGTAASFDGINNHIELGNNLGYQLSGNLTIEFWIKPTNISKGRQNPIHKAYGGEFSFTLEPYEGMSFYQGSAKGDNAPYWNGYYIWPVYTFSDNNWFHIALTRNTSSRMLKGYLNGILLWEQAWKPIEEDPSVSSNNLWIGSGYAGNFQGIIDEIRIYNTTLAAEEIKKAYENPRYKTQNSLVLDLNFSAS